ncbi:MAG: 16S rRNA (guanine(527)-N(7))-methyltransferase RsmG [Agarilytica sp.]
MPKVKEFNRSELSNLLQEGCAELALTIEPEQQIKLLDYLQAFHKWNKTYNLSAIRDPKDMLFKHLLDSLAILPHFQNSPALEIADVGTGGGLPGVPLAICLPAKNFSLIDSAGKKTRFLQQTAHELRLNNVNVVNKRVEEHRPERACDVVVSRAFASIEDMVSGCEHLLTESGEFWAMKGLFPDEELSHLPSCYKVDSCSEIRVPGDIGERCLVVIKPSSSST